MIALFATVNGHVYHHTSCSNWSVLYRSHFLFLILSSVLSSVDAFFSVTDICHDPSDKTRDERIYSGTRQSSVDVEKRLLHTVTVHTSLYENASIPN